MAYTTGDFEQDVIKVARSLHLAYRRASFLLDRWNAGMNSEFPIGTFPAINNLMNRADELKTDYDATSGAKLNTVLAISDLQLPGDE